MRTLTKNLDRAGELLRLAVNAPRFDEEPFERVREHMNARLRHDANDPGHSPTALEGEGVPPSSLWPAGRRNPRVARADRATDLVNAAKRGIARDQLLIAIVGAIDDKGAAALVDEPFAELPAEGDLKPFPTRRFTGLGELD